MEKICLVMIIKDELPVLKRCIESVKPFINSWVIVDTGSTDGSRGMVQALLGHLPGKIIDRPWVDFGTNRSEALKFARESGANWSFMIDADETLIFDYDDNWDGARKARNRLLSDLSKFDAISMRIKFDGLIYARTCLFNNKVPWRFVGPVHEYPTCDKAFEEYPILRRMWIEPKTDGARSRTGDKFKKDIELLEIAIKIEPNNERNRFYLAQSYRDDGDNQKAFEHYMLRTVMGGWDEEVYCSYYQAALAAQRLKLQPQLIIKTFLDAYNYRPTRAEALVALARYLSTIGMHEAAIIFAEKSLNMRIPDDNLYVEQSAYSWAGYDALSVASYWTNRRKAAIESANAALFMTSSMPAEDRLRIEKNLKAAHLLA